LTLDVEKIGRKAKKEVKNMNMRAWMIVAGAVGGAALLGAGAFAVWNSKQMRMMPTAKRTGKLLYKLGSAMQAVSGIAEDM
jgi:hypothetical protein